MTGTTLFCGARNRADRLRRSLVGGGQADDRNLLPGEVEERDQLDRQRQGAAADHADARQPNDGALLDQSVGGAVVRRQVRARSAADLDRRLDAEAGDARCELRRQLPRPLAPWALAAAGRDAELADGARVHHRHEQRGHGESLTTNGAGAITCQPRPRECPVGDETLLFTPPRPTMWEGARALARWTVFTLHS